jgi:CRISPR-associated protein Cas2
MSMTVIVTTNVASRFRGFLASCMLEIAPGVYSAPRLNKGVRQRVWTVCEEWFDDFSDGSIVMTWKDPNEPGGQGIRTLGLPPKEIYEHEGLLLVRTEFTKKQHRMVGTSGQVET